MEPTEFLGDCSEFDMMLPWVYKEEVKSIPRPYFLSVLFPEVPMAICRPLEPPFDNFAITHYGTVFNYRPLITTEMDKMRMLDPTQIVQGRITNDNPVITLNSRSGYRKTFLVYRLVLERFYKVPLTERIEINFIDGDSMNTHVANLEAMLI